MVGLMVQPGQVYINYKDVMFVIDSIDQPHDHGRLRTLTGPFSGRFETFSVKEAEIKILEFRIKLLFPKYNKIVELLYVK